ncbi:MAG: DUF2158 domain-containing protein [Bradyrhizobium sp.]|nr:DUF2158 domain-containing protein [Bradyrhizobium sp.]
MRTLAKQSSLAAVLILAISAFSSIPARSQQAAEFARGDIVQLRSGGPLMTVLVMKNGLVNVLWTDNDGWPHDVTYPVGVLQKSDVTEGGPQASNLALRDAGEAR